MEHAKHVRRRRRRRRRGRLRAVAIPKRYWASRRRSFCERAAATATARRTVNGCCRRARVVCRIGIMRGRRRRRCKGGETPLPFFYIYILFRIRKTWCVCVCVCWWYFTGGMRRKRVGGFRGERESDEEARRSAVVNALSIKIKKNSNVIARGREAHTKRNVIRIPSAIVVTQYRTIRVRVHSSICTHTHCPPTISIILRTRHVIYVTARRSSVSPHVATVQPLVRKINWEGNNNNCFEWVLNIKFFIIRI